MKLLLTKARLRDTQGLAGFSQLFPGSFIYLMQGPTAALFCPLVRTVWSDSYLAGMGCSEGLSQTGPKLEAPGHPGSSLTVLDEPSPGGLRRPRSVQPQNGLVGSAGCFQGQGTHCCFYPLVDISGGEERQTVAQARRAAPVAICKPHLGRRRSSKDCPQ